MRLDGAGPDPLTGRPGCQEDPVWAPVLRGRWRGGSAEIDLFGYAYDPQQIAVLELLEPILWLLHAEALAHEVAHASDATCRRARDRWALDEHTRGEEWLLRSTMLHSSSTRLAIRELPVFLVLRALVRANR